VVTRQMYFFKSQAPAPAIVPVVTPGVCDPCAAPAAAIELFDEELIDDADLPALPAEQYTSVWEAILAHL
jgi:hypothetical protein